MKEWNYCVKAILLWIEGTVNINVSKNLNSFKNSSFTSLMTQKAEGDLLKHAKRANQ